MSDDILMFFDGHRAALPIYEKLESEILRRYPDTAVEVRRTQISFKSRRLFACASFLPAKRRSERPDPYLTVTFGLDHPLCHERVAVTTEAQPNRWTHHVLVGRAEEIDAQLLEWIGEAHDFAGRR